jgi:ribosomal protein L18
MWCAANAPPEGITMKTPDQANTTTEATAVAAQCATGGPKKAASTKAASLKKTTPKAKTGKKTAAKATSNTIAEKASAKGRANSKKIAVLDLLRRKDGATLAEIAKATGWKNHSIRGFISGTVGKRMGLKVESWKSDTGERTYKIAGK